MKITRVVVFQIILSEEKYTLEVKTMYRVRVWYTEHVLE
jgi:hypothetical protein